VKEVALTASDIADRLKQHSRILYNNCTCRAIALWTLWQSFNDQNGPDHEVKLGSIYSAGALNWLMQSALHETIIIVTRAFDGYRKDVVRTDRVSFLVLEGLLQLPGVREEVVQRARSWLDGAYPEHHDEAVTKAMTNMLGSLDRLKNETPNRLTILRNYRDQFLAHNLVIDAQRDRPIFQYVTDLLEELVTLTEQAELAFSGGEIAWDFYRREVTGSADALWTAIRTGLKP